LQSSQQKTEKVIHNPLAHVTDACILDRRTCSMHNAQLGCAGILKHGISGISFVKQQEQQNNNQNNYCGFHGNTFLYF